MTLGKLHHRVLTRRETLGISHAIAAREKSGER
jgi:hypothetical protein